MQDLLKAEKYEKRVGRKNPLKFHLLTHSAPYIQKIKELDSEKLVKSQLPD